MVSSWTFFSLVGHEVIGSQHHQPSDSSLGSMFLWSTVFIWWGSASCKNNLGMCVRPLSMSFREQ